jgi:hypothetical protein
MDKRDNDPTTQEHHKLANELMLGLGFEWDTQSERWIPAVNFVLQGEATNAVKKLLANTGEKE